MKILVVAPDYALAKSVADDFVATSSVVVQTSEVRNIEDAYRHSGATYDAVLFTGYIPKDVYEYMISRVRTPL